MFNPAQILILTGPPGAGKTTAASRLAQRPGCPKVHLHADDFWHAIKAGAIAPWQADAHEQNAVVIDVLAGAAARYAQGGYFVLLDGIVGPWFLDAFRHVPCVVHYVVLRPALDEAIRRCRDRGGDALSDPGPITALHQQFVQLGALEGHVLPVAALDVAQTCEAISGAVQSGRFRLP